MILKPGTYKITLILPSGDMYGRRLIGKILSPKEVYISNASKFTLQVGDYVVVEANTEIK